MIQANLPLYENKKNASGLSGKKGGKNENMDDRPD